MQRSSDESRRSAENTWVSVDRGRLLFFVGKAGLPVQRCGDGSIVSAIRYGDEVMATLKNGKIAVYSIKNGRSISGPVRIISP